MELEPNTWYCIVACNEYDYDFNSFNVYGPCTSADGAFNKMNNSESNPGQSCELPFKSLSKKEIKQMKKRFNIS